MSSLIGPATITDPADPNRCQGLVKGRQCLNKAEPGKSFCLACIGNPLVEREERGAYEFDRAEDRRRIDALCKKHHSEIVKGMLHMMVVSAEDHFNKRVGGDDPAWLNASTKFAKEIGRLQKQIEEAEKESHELLGREALMQSAVFVIKESVDEVQLIFQEFIENVEAWLATPERDVMLLRQKLPTWEDVATRIGERCLSFLRNIENKR